jgi:predicted lipoprotein with Yx(FWY)xxD motif/type III secretion system FlhB-like substrate exporter
MGKRALTSVLLASLCLTPAFAAPLQKAEINPGANWALHADVDAFRNSTLGKLVLAELKAQGVEEKLQGLAAMISFNPLTDLRGVTLYGKGQDRNSAVAIFDGQVNSDALLNVVRWNPQYQEIPYEGVTLYRWLNEDKKKDTTTDQLMYGYIHNGQRVVISSGLDALKQAVSTLKGSAAGTSTGLLNQIPQAASGTYLQIAATGIGDIVGQDPKAAILKQADSLNLTAGEVAEKVSIGVRLQGQSPEVADNILKMAQGVVAMAQLAVQEQPKLSELAKSVNISREDKIVQARFEAPAQSIFAFLKEQWAKKNQQQQTPQTKPQ